MRDEVMTNVDESRVKTEQEYEVERLTKKIEKKILILRGACEGSPEKYKNTVQALGFARRKHAGQTRKSGVPYIIHPLSVACDALAMGFRDDIIIATCLLHDVLEDNKDTSALDLPVSDEVKRAVECLTIKYGPNEGKYDGKKDYYEKLKTNKYAILVKGLDRQDNFKSLAQLGPDSIKRNLYETQYLLLPILGDAKEIWPEYGGQLHMLRTMLRSVINNLAYDHKIILPYEQPSDTEMREIFS